MSDLAYLTAADGAALLRAKKLSPVEWTRALLDRIAAIDSHTNAYLTVTADKALAQAKAAEAEIAKGRIRGPMHGVPYAAKDIFDIEGMATTCHSKIRKDHRAASDAFVVKKLNDAGAVLLGKLALHEFATGGPAFDLPWPPARNPWNRDHHPGGSSSGSGAALAAGLAPAALGTDTGGSVRNPATCCGIVGLKPTYGAVSLNGVFPLTHSLDHVGPMTRTVEDNAILFHTIAGHDPADPTSTTRAAADTLKDLKSGVKGLRIGLIEHFYTEDAPADPEQVRGIEQATELLRKLGATVQPIRLSPLPLWTDCNRTIHNAEAYAIHERDIQTRPEDFASLTRNRIIAGAFMSAAKYIKAQQLRAALCREFAEAMRGLDAVITLSSLLLPCRIDDPATIAKTYDQQARLVFNVTGTPAISVPTGFAASGLPLAMQIAGRAFDEPVIMRIAQVYCEAAGTCIGADPKSQPRLPQPARTAAE
ncbi:amidase [Rhodoplanes sp. Z2-YC6860]|uniref:amidase n=1 Tax=Rhodoplanes sp. Z2-YC6860 TaxID=674703 RepID=UPI00078EB7AA|nr:amidase [Rhodoplanes sp. Z2-YC6860]AMN39435.1 amidase [Rhodoplanes sp. Z2-YC6860]